MSDQLNNDGDTVIDESTLDPKLIEYFAAKYRPLADKKDELLGKLGTYKALEKELDALGGLETVKSLKQKADEAAQKAETERLAALAKDGKLTEIEAHYQKLLAEKDNKLTTFQQSLVNKEVDARLAKAIRDEGGNPALLSHIIRSRVEATMGDDGEVQITVKGAAGQTLGEDGKPLSLKSLVGEIKSNADYAGAFSAHQASGGGSRKGGGTTTANNPFASGTMNITEQMRLIKNQPEIARTLAKEAGQPVDW